MSNADAFLNHFHEIERWMKKKLEKYEHTSFSEMVRVLKPIDPIIRRYSDDLYQYASLRNSIVHTRKGNLVIAEPYIETVNAIKIIRDEILLPPNINISSNIFSVSKGDSIDLFLNCIREYDYSQVPVYDENQMVIEVINTNTIARWLSAKTVDDIISLKETVINDLLSHVEYPKNYKFIARDTNLYEAAAIFQSFSANNKHNLDTLFVTENGKPNKKLLGLVCIQDVAQYSSIS